MLGEIKIYRNINEALEDGIANSAYISTENRKHKEETINCLGRGLHCLVEKPMVWDLKSYDEVIQKARGSDLCVLESFQFQWHERFEQIIEEIDNRQIGEIKQISMRFGCPPSLMERL